MSQVGSIASNALEREELSAYTAECIGLAKDAEPTGNSISTWIVDTEILSGVRSTIKQWLEFIRNAVN
jgi:hypothetical protein